MLQGFRISTEREIAQGYWLGGEAGIAGKRPDVLLRAGGSVWWVEVEKSRKNAKDYQALLKWLDAMFPRPPARTPFEASGLRLKCEKVIFICSLAFEAKLGRDLQARGWAPEKVKAFLIFDTELYSFEDIDFT